MTPYKGAKSLIQLDVDYLFTVVGGPKGLLALLDKHVPDHNLSYPQVQMWKQRRAVAGRFVSAVVYALVRDGVPVLNCFLDDAGDDLPP